MAISERNLIQVLLAVRMVRRVGGEARSGGVRRGLVGPRPMRYSAFWRMKTPWCSPLFSELKQKSQSLTEILKDFCESQDPL